MLDFELVAVLDYNFFSIPLAVDRNASRVNSLIFIKSQNVLNNVFDYHFGCHFNCHLSIESSTSPMPGFCRSFPIQLGQGVDFFDFPINGSC